MSTFTVYRDLQRVSKFAMVLFEIPRTLRQILLEIRSIKNNNLKCIVSTILLYLQWLQKILVHSLIFC